MDVEVEMVRSTDPPGRDGLLVSAKAEETTFPHTISSRMRRPSICLMVMVLTIFVAVVGKIYLDPEGLITIRGGVYTPEEGTIGKSAGTKVAEAMGQIRNRKGHGNTAERLNNRHKIETSETYPTNIDPEDTAQTWFAANVTLKDGQKYEIIEKLGHDRSAFTEGLTFAKGILYESTGMNGRSSVRVLDPATGQVMESYPMSPQLFGEGMTFMNDRLVQLTYKAKTGFIYNANNLTEEPETFPFSTTRNEGWGLTYDHRNNELIASDGSNKLHFWDALTLTEVRRISVYRQDGSPATNINELEYWRGRVLANVWFEDVLLVIHPESGVVEKEYDFSSLWPKRERHSMGADVLNGISVSSDPDILFMTGKNWDRMFRVKLLH
jgi:glutamine cyclotransferase